MGFSLTRFNTDFWITVLKCGYDYIGTHTDNLIVFALNLSHIFEEQRKTYMIKDCGVPKLHLGFSYKQINVVKKACFVMGYTTYTSESLTKICALLGVANL